MFKKSKWRIATETASLLSILCLGFIFSILAASCNESSKKNGQNDSSSASTAVNQSSGSDHAHPRQNWLDDPLLRRWESMAFNNVSDPNDTVQINRVKRNVRIYVRGWLAEWVAENPDSAKYVVDSFYFERKSPMPLKYTIKAFLQPDAHHHGGVGGHLIPPEPDPPPGGFQ